MYKKIVCVCLTVLLAAVACCFAGCQGNSATKTELTTYTGSVTYPLTVTDGTGVEVTLDAKPERIVSLSPANTEIVFALGAEERLVGRTDYCNYPAEASTIASVGEYASPSVEKIVALKPDLVLALDFIDDGVRSQIEATGAKVVVLMSGDVDTSLMNIVTTGQLLDVNDVAKKLVDELQVERQEIVDTCAKAETQKSVFIDLGEYYSAGPGSMLDAMLTEINAKNIAGNASSAWPLLSTEEIVAGNPDVYISFYTSAEDIKKVSAFADINAVKNDAVVWHDLLSSESDAMQRSGPRIIEGLRSLAEDVYPELFE